MKLCSNNHEEIIFNSRNCPLCEAKEEIERWEKGVIAQWEKGEDSLKFRIETLENEIKNVH